MLAYFNKMTIENYNLPGFEILGISGARVSDYEGKGRLHQKFQGEIISTDGESKFELVYAPTIPETKQYIRKSLKGVIDQTVTDLHVECHGLKNGDPRKQEIKDQITALWKLDSRLKPGVLQSKNTLGDKLEGGQK